MSKKEEYVAGVCNIGKFERMQRHYTGLFGLVIAFVIMILIHVKNFSPYWKLTMFFPILLATFGFIQDRKRFCIQFGFENKYSFNEKEHHVKKHLDHIKDRRTASHLLIQSIALAIFFTLFVLILDIGTLIE